MFQVLFCVHMSSGPTIASCLPKCNTYPHTFFAKENTRISQKQMKWISQGKAETGMRGKGRLVLHTPRLIQCSLYGFSFWN